MTRRLVLVTASGWRWIGVALQVGAWVAIALLVWPDNFELIATPWVIMFVAFGLAGLLLVVRRPTHPVGWLALVLGVMASSGIVCLVIASRLIDSGAAVAGAWVDAAGNAVMTAGMLAAPAILVVFPDGTIPRRYGRPLLWLVVLSALVGAAAALVNGGWGGDPSQAVAPSPLRRQAASLGDGLAYAFYMLLAASMIGAGASVLNRWRRSEGLERQQIKWLAVGTTVAVVAMAVTGFNTSEQWEIVVGATAFSTIPIAIVAAILRYRLYEIDRIISRTVSYAIVVGLLGALFVMIAVGLPNLVAGVGESPLLVAVSTLAVAALFNPLRRRVQVMVDQRFNRSRYDASLVMDAFAGSLRHQVDSHQVIAGWMSVVEETMQPSVVGVWVRS